MTWTHANPHKPNAFQLSLRQTTLGGHAADTPLALSSLRRGAISALDLWTGTVTATTDLVTGQSLHVSACVHPEIDLLALTLGVTGASTAVNGAVSLRLAFPYATGNAQPSNWGHEYDLNHTTAVLPAPGGGVWIKRGLDDDSYSLRCEWTVEAGGLAQPGQLVLVQRHVIDLLLPAVSSPFDLIYPVAHFPNPPYRASLLTTI